MCDEFSWFKSILGGLHRIEKKSDGSFVVVDYEEDEQRTILTQLKKGFDNNVEIR